MNNQNNNQNNNQIIGYDPQTGQPIYSTNNLINQNQTINSNQEVNLMNTQFNNTIATSNEQPLDKKELKKIKKEEKKKILKAREIIGTNYLITLILVNIAPVLFFEKVLEGNILLQNILSWVWYIILPFVGAYLIKTCQFNKLKTYITSENYKKIRNYSILDLIVLGFFHIGINLNILVIPALISYVLSAIYLINEMDKLSKQV